MRKKKKFSVIITIAVVIIFTIVTTKDSSLINTSASQKSNKKIEWGIKRAENHEQPDLGKNNKEIADKYNAIAMGNEKSKSIYLTFDAGYEAGYTEKILDVLKENNVKAVFFVTGHYVNSAENIVKRMVDEGHYIGNHTMNHKDIVSLSNEEIQKEVMDLHKLVYEKFGQEMKYYRPPKGEFSERTIEYINNLEYTSVMWSLAYDDWDENKQNRIDYAKEKIVNNLHNGAVILLHSNSKDNANVLDYVIKEARKQGYEFKTLDEFEK